MASDIEQETFHKMIIKSLQDLLDNDTISEMIGDDNFNLNNLCNQQSFIWNISNKLKFVHRSLQFITIKWRANNEDKDIWYLSKFYSIFKKIENIPRLFDVVIYDKFVYYVYAITLKQQQLKRNSNNTTTTTTP